MILEEPGSNPSHVHTVSRSHPSLDHTVKDLLSFFNGFQGLHETKRVIEKRCAIKKEPGHKCWTEDDIKKAWKETRKEKKKSRRRRHWARVIMLQIVKCFVCDTCKQNAAQKKRDATTVEQGCETTPISEDASSQSSDEPNTDSADEKRSGTKHKSVKKGVSKKKKSDSPRRSCIQPRDRNLIDKINRKSREKNKCIEDETISCIYIPLSKLFLNEPTAADAVVQNVSSPYKLIDGFPSQTDLRKINSYTMSFSNVTNNAEWVYEVLNSETLKDNSINVDSFRPDYHKGHLAAAANHRWCREANNDTYLFSNIIPQHKKLNQGIWKTSENRCREKAKKDNVHVYSGPLYLRKDTGGVYTRVHDTSEMDRLEKKTIPTHLFKVIIVEYEDGTVEKPKCYMMPNEEPEYKDLKMYKKTIEYIEEVSGLTFIKRCHNANMTDHIKSVTLQGECLKEELCTANINVRISS